MTDVLIRVRSAGTFAQTIRRLGDAMRQRGMTLFASIDHAAGAREVGLALRPTEVLIFGSAKVGTPVMQAQQSAALDLPLKALVFEDEAGAAWVVYADPHRLAADHALGPATAGALDAMAKALAGVVAQATAVA